MSADNLARDFAAVLTDVNRMGYDSEDPMQYPKSRAQVAARKLAELQAKGFTISGYSVERTEDNNQVTRGFITHGGLVGWWHPENAEPAAPAWKPEFDAMSPRQEQLVVQFCAEIAGPKGRAGSAPDPVRLLEMAQALYEAEREDAAIDAAQQTR